MQVSLWKCIHRLFSSVKHMAPYQCTESFSDEVELVNVRLPRPERIPMKQLSEDASQSPHVHRRPILSIPDQQLRSAVPAGRYVVCVVILWSS